MKNEVIGRTWAPLAGQIASEPLAPHTRLRVTNHITAIRTDELITKIDLGGKLASLDADSSRRVTSLFARLDGARSLAEVAGDLGWSLEDTTEAAQQLFELAVLENAGDTPIDALVFYRHVAALGRGVQARVTERSSYVGLVEQRPTRRLLLGYLVETYHIVVAAALHIAPTISLAPTLRLRMMFSEYLGDEYWHGLWLRKGLVAAGLSELEIDSADPLPATLATINHLRCIASTDLLAYAACISTGENLGVGDAEHVRRRFDAFTKHGVLPDAAISPFRDHEVVDCEAGHQSYCAEVFADSSPLTHAHQDAITRAMLHYLRCLEAQHREVEQFYGSNPEGPPVYSAGWRQVHSTP
jgi:pyrroloquinoline quinone (PQQ) biosynthesis protein C